MRQSKNLKNWSAEKGSKSSKSSIGEFLIYIYSEFYFIWWMLAVWIFTPRHYPAVLKWALTSSKLWGNWLIDRCPVFVPFFPVTTLLPPLHLFASCLPIVINSNTKVQCNVRLLDYNTTWTTVYIVQHWYLLLYY